MIKKLPTPTTGQMAYGIKERDIHNKINELVEAYNNLEQSSIIRNGPLVQDLLDGIMKIKEHALNKARERLRSDD